MKQNSLDAIAVTGEENYTYFTGAVSLVPWASFTRPVFCLIPLEREPIVLVSKTLEESTKELSYVSDIRVHLNPSGLPARLVEETIREAGLSRARIGMELGYEQRLGIAYNDFQAIVKGLPDVALEDASALFWRLRMKKSAEEIELVRRACEITARARQSCFDQIHEGMTEKDVGRLFRMHMIEFGADDVAFVMVNSLLPFQSNRRLVKGGVLYLDGGWKVGGYCCDYARLATLGPSSETQRSMHQTLVRANEKMAETLRPGVRCSEVFRAYAQIIQEAGVSVSTIGRVGHGQGMFITEPPSISPTDDTSLESGFVVSTEPSMSSSDGDYIIEDVHVITEDGKMTLTTEPSELRELYLHGPVPMEQMRTIVRCVNYFP
jgi:Xaa-Pro aminopeptidase